MPSSHRRVGLILDESMSSAFAVLREQLGPAVPEARLARTAVIDGAAFGAVLREATAGGSGSQEAARRVLREMRELLTTLTLPPQVKTVVIDEIDRVSRDTGVQERRQRQLALLDAPNPYGAAALDVTESIDALDRRFG